MAAIKLIGLAEKVLPSKSELSAIYSIIKSINYVIKTTQSMKSFQLHMVKSSLRIEIANIKKKWPRVLSLRSIKNNKFKKIKLVEMLADTKDAQKIAIVAEYMKLHVLPLFPQKLYGDPDQLYQKIVEIQATSQEVPVHIGFLTGGEDWIYKENHYLATASLSREQISLLIYSSYLKHSRLFDSIQRRLNRSKTENRSGYAERG